MTIDDAIKGFETFAELLEVEKDFLSDSEISEEIEKQKQLAEWLKDYKRLKEQKPILDKIRAEIKALSPEPTVYDVVEGNPVKDAIWEILIEVDKIIDKYRAESEDKR